MLQEPCGEWVPAPAPRLSRTPAEAVTSKVRPEVGQHSVQVLQEFQVAKEEISRLLDTGAVEQVQIRASL